MRYTLIKILFVALILFQFAGTAQTFNVGIDNTTVSDNQPFQVSFTFSGKNINDIGDFTAPGFSDFYISSGPNQSTSMQFINGSSSASVSYSYVLQAKGVGSFEIGKASIQYDGKTYETKPLTIKVVKGSTQPKQPQQQQAEEDNGISDKDIADNLFIRAFVDKNKVYKGEQVIVTYKLYTRLNIASQMSINKLPQYQGFWAEELESTTNIFFTTEMYQGKQYRVGVLKKAALFPSQTGQLEVTPFELNVPVQVQVKSKKNGKSLWDEFFQDPFGRYETRNYNAVSNKVKVDVLPLPEENKLTSFNGAVGDFTFSSTINHTNVKTNEPITIKLSVSGFGNISLLNLPEVNLPAGFEKYEPKLTESINRKNSISGSKSGEYLFVPRVVGKREVPPIEFSYFNPAKKKYITIKSDPIELNIEQGATIPSAEITDKEEVKQLGQDIYFIKTDTDDLQKNETYIITKPTFWVMSAVPFIASMFLIGFKRKHDKLSGNVALMRYQKAQKVAKNRLKAAKKYMDAENHKDFYTEISLALFGYLEDKLHITKSEFTVERAVEILSAKNVKTEITDSLKNTANKCEFVRFAPGAEKSAVMNEMYNELVELIINIEKAYS
jgi:BatD DUF11 like domain